MVIVDGFFEWREFKGKKYPYYIFMKNEEPFAFAGIWDEWTEPDTGEILKTFSIITCDANDLLSKIHNTKKRMPVILDKQDEEKWLDKSLDKVNIEKLLKPYKENNLEAYTVSKMITQRGVEKNTPDILKPFDYTELNSNIIVNN